MKVNKEQQKFLEYSEKVTRVLGLLFNKESEFCLNEFELGEDVDVKNLIHAFANVAPCYLYNKITGEDADWLEFNHLANHLNFEFMTKE